MNTIFETFRVSGEGLGVQRRRLSAIANNIANANTTRTENGKAYQREVVIVKGGEQRNGIFDRELQGQLSLQRSDGAHFSTGGLTARSEEKHAVNATVAKDSAPARMIYDPAHPDANGDGYVAMPNVNIVTEMVDMISAQRSFEANTQTISAAKNMAKDSLEI
jgi:flagellar basal-body rod protein FlgC